jgi:hypothetical protein
MPEPFQGLLLSDSQKELKWRPELEGKGAKEGKDEKKPPKPATVAPKPKPIPPNAAPVVPEPVAAPVPAKKKRHAGGVLQQVLLQGCFSP